MNRWLLVFFVILSFVAVSMTSAQEPQQPNQSGAGEKPAKADFPAVVFELRVSDVAAAAKFYRDGIGMQVVTEDAKEVLLSLFGTGLRLLHARGGKNSPRKSDVVNNPMFEVLEANGFRYPSFWFRDTSAVLERLEKAGYSKIQQGKKSNRFLFATAPAGTPPLDLPSTKKKFTTEPSKTGASEKEEVSEQQQSGEPPLKKMPNCDATRDAAGRGQLFESIIVQGFTSIREGTNGFAIANLNHDGLLDIVACYSPPRDSGAGWGPGEKLRVFINQGDFQFKEHPIKLLDSKVSPDEFGRGQVPVLADFNNDGHLDIFVTRHAQMSGGKSNPRDEKIGNGLYITDGAWDVFRDVSSKMGIQNEKAYNRQPSLGDVNNDGWLDIAVGCDNIGNAMGGFPHSRLYVFKPNGDKFEDGRFEDIGGTELVPDFGGFYHDSAKDKAGPDINLRDLNNDGLLDLIFAADPDNSGIATDPSRYEDKVYWNTGNHGGKENHWIRLRFSGVTHAELIGARVLAYEPEEKKLIGVRVIAADQSYKSGSPLEAHFGLGKREKLDISVILINGKRFDFSDLKPDRYIDVNLSTRTISDVSVRK